MMISRGQPVFVLVLSVCIGLLPVSVFAAATGQIKGTITDNDGNPIVGASIQIVGTLRGAMTDVDGKYIISQVEPGTYVLKITHVHYREVEVQNVEVKSDVTKDVSQDLEEKVVGLDDKIVVRDKIDPIARYETATQQVIRAEQIDVQPVTTVQDLLKQVAGVVTGREGEIFIRGGRAGEVSYILDGVPVDDPLSGVGGQAGANLSLVSGSIQEFTVIKDGFDPEYGDALSGIIKITTKTGSKDNTRVNMQFITDDFGNRDLNKYSRNNDYVRFSLSGPEPMLRNKVLPALGLGFLEDKELTYYFYSEVEKSDGFYQYNRFDTPVTRRNNGFFDLFGFRIPERAQNRYHWMMNLKFRPQQNLKFIFSYKDTQIRNTQFTWPYRYSSATATVYREKLRVVSLEVLQALTKNMNYEAIVSFSRNSKSWQPGDPNNPGKGLDPPQIGLEETAEYYNDDNGNGVYDPPEPIINVFPDTTTYGNGFTGPAYTPSEYYLYEDNAQAGTGNFSGFLFNTNPIIDDLEGEPFIDLNGNGVWDRGDYLNDVNGNGILDDDRIPRVRTPLSEPFIDGDSIIGEDFIDVNRNGVYDEDIDDFTRCVCPENMDINHNGTYDGPGTISPFEWTPGVPFLDRNGNGLFDPPNGTYDPGEPFTDVNGNSKWDAGGTSTFLEPYTYDDTTRWHNRNVDTYRGELKLFREMGAHQLKAGAAFRKLDFTYEYIERPYVEYLGRADGGPFEDRGAFRDMFYYEPLFGTVYVRDKLEYGSLIASLGLRWDFFIQDKEKLIPVAENDDLGEGIIKGDRQKLSPRIGFSYPISDKAKVHFNYGHFYQFPSLVYMYARNTATVDQNAIVGNYNLNYKKTVQYSFGVKYAMSEDYSIDISGYFKDEFDKVNVAEVNLGGLTKQQYRNSDYGRSRGFEIQIDKHGGGYVNGMVSYTYAFAYGKASEAARVWQSPEDIAREPLSEAPLNDDVRHKFNASVQVFVPSTVKPRLFGLPIPNAWSLAVISRIESGKPFTPSREYPNVDAESGEDIQRNSLRMPSIVNFDIRFTKDFKFVGLDCSYILWIENLFDSRNVLGVYRNTGRPDTRQNQSQIIKGGTEYDSDPANWDYSRQIRMGLEVNLSI
jgi:outer membrane receptor protein involved in Fe transport